jgi:enterobactin synthetase component D / holo-[acyl-carrier protein] synthase
MDANLMSRLLPASVAVVEASAAQWEAEMLPEEARVVARSVPRRQREFAAGRACARLALARLGYQPAPLLPGPDRAPAWPQGAVGSITHCRDYCAAAAARRSELRALGIDAELNQPLPEGVAELVCTPLELDWSASAQPRGADWRTLVFSAKESVYKAWQPLTGEWLGYRNVELRIDAETGTFEARLLVPAPAALGTGFSSFSGGFVTTPSHILTAVALAAA